MNILLTSISKKIPLIRAVQYALQSLNLQGTVIGADSNPQCIGRYFVNQFWQISPDHQLSINEILAYCRQYHIKAIIPTRDAELPFYAKHCASLQAEGIACLISSEDTIALCTDKLRFCEFLTQHKFPAIPTSSKLNDIHSSSFVVKEQFSTTSKGVKVKLSSQEAQNSANAFSHPLFQPYIEGDEYSIDLYVDRQGNIKGPVVRKREYVVNGESQITSSLKYPRLEQLCIEMASTLKLYGHAVFQIICDKDQDNLHVIECNPRFGGASTLSLAMGLHSFEWFLLETLKIPLPPFERAPQEKRQVRFPSDIVLPYEE